MTIEAIKDPTFKGMKSFYWYTLIQGHYGSMEEHLAKVIEAVLEDKPSCIQFNYKVIYYSVPDARGMRFLRKQGDYYTSDFRHEWVVDEDK